jgi:hypothetical protein
MRAGLSSLQELFPGPQARLHGPCRPGSARFAITVPVPRPARPCPDSDPLSPPETSRSRPGHDRSVTGAPHQGPRMLCFLRALYPVGHRSRHPPGLPRGLRCLPAPPLQPGLLRLIRARATAYPQHPTPGTLTGAARGCYFVHADKHGPTSQAGPLKPTSSSRAAPADPDDAPVQSGPLRLTRMRATPAPASQSCKSLGDLRPRGVMAGAGLRSTTAASGSPRAGSPSHPQAPEPSRLIKA